MILPNDDPQILAAVRRYVMPDRRYMKLHGWNLEHMEESRRNRFVGDLIQDAQQATDTELTLLLRSDWRPRLTASWLIAATARDKFRELLGSFLHTSDSSNVLKGACFALTRFGTHNDAVMISDFLHRNLTPGSPATAQNWALAGLLHIDRNLGTSYASEFLDGESEWRTWQGNPNLPAEESLIPRLLFFIGDSGASNGHTAAEQGNLAAPEELYAAWKPVPLPSHWEIIQSESSRRVLDEAVISSNAGMATTLQSSAPLSVAQCRDCDMTLFNTAPGAGGWFIARTRSATEAAGNTTGIDMFPTYSDIEETLMGHRH